MDRLARFSLGVLLFLAPTARAAERGLTPEDSYRIEIPNDPHLSPDGKRVAFVVASTDAQKRRTNTVWVASTDGGSARPFSALSVSASAPRFSPDGRWLAFLSTRPAESGPAADKPQVYVMSLDGGEARRVTSLPNGATAFEWSPDGNRFACVARVDPPKDDLAFERTDTRRYRDIFYKLDGQGWSDGKRAHLFVVDVASGRAQQVTNGEHWNDTDPDWSPDGKRLAFVSDRASKDTDWDGRHADVWLVSAEGGEPTKVSDHDEADTSPAWSPDGTSIAFLGSLGEGDHPKVYVVSAAGGPSRAVAPKMNQLAQRPAWSGDGKTIFFEAPTLGASHLFAVDLASQQVRQVTSGPRRLRSFERHEATRRMVFRSDEPTRAPELVVAELDGRNEKSLTSLNAGLLGERRLQPIERVTWRGPLNWEIEGFLIKPLGFDPSKKYPLLMWVHGGPNGMHGNEWLIDNQVWASHGYAVFLPNPRGSSGYGAEFQRAVANEWGGKAYEDLMAGVDSLLRANPWIDAERLGVIGHSYGGFMTEWIVGHTTRFKAAVAVAGIANLVSVQGTRDAAYNHRRDFGGDLFGAYQRYWETSPLKYAAQVKTPTLILHGLADNRVPSEQGEEWFRALKHFGVETELVLFPRGSHGFRTSGEPKQVVEALNWQLYWMAKFLGGEGPAAAPKAPAP